jgi:hypothetical protein
LPTVRLRSVTTCRCWFACRLPVLTLPRSYLLLRLFGCVARWFCVTFVALPLVGLRCCTLFVLVTFTFLLRGCCSSLLRYSLQLFCYVVVVLLIVLTFVLPFSTCSPHPFVALPFAALPHLICLLPLLRLIGYVTVRYRGCGYLPVTTLPVPLPLFDGYRLPLIAGPPRTFTVCLLQFTTPAVSGLLVVTLHWLPLRLLLLTLPPFHGSYHRLLRTGRALVPLFTILTLRLFTLFCLVPRWFTFVGYRFCC